MEPDARDRARGRCIDIGVPGSSCHFGALLRYRRELPRFVSKLTGFARRSAECRLNASGRVFCCCLVLRSNIDG